MEKTMTPKTTSIACLCAAAAAFLLLGCGSNAVMTNSDPAAAFAGSWTFGSGSLQPMCTGLGASITPIDLTGDTMTIVHVDATHVSTTLMGSGVDCDINFTVNNSTATAETGQMCMVSVNVGGQATAVPINTWTLTVSGNALSMSMTGSANPVIFTCTPTADGMATRAGDGGT
jgi:hypothetical protein